MYFILHKLFLHEVVFKNKKWSRAYIFNAIYVVRAPKSEWLLNKPVGGEIFSMLSLPFQETQSAFLPGRRRGAGGRAAFLVIKLTSPDSQPLHQPGGNPWERRSKADPSETFNSLWKKTSENQLWLWTKKSAQGPKSCFY